MARHVDRITAYLFHAGGDEDPAPLMANDGQELSLGAIVLGMGFTFDDTDKKDVASLTCRDGTDFICKDPRNGEAIFPYHRRRGTERQSNSCAPSVRDQFRRLAARARTTRTRWVELTMMTHGSGCGQELFPRLPGPVAADFPDLFAIVESRVKPNEQRASD